MMRKSFNWIIRLMALSAILLSFVWIGEAVHADVTVTQGSGSSTIDVSSSDGLYNVVGQYLSSNNTLVGHKLTRLGFKIKSVGTPVYDALYEIYDASNNLVWSGNLSKSVVTSSYQWLSISVPSVDVYSGYFIGISTLSVYPNSYELQQSVTEVESTGYLKFHSYTSGVWSTNPDQDMEYTADYLSNELSVVTGSAVYDTPISVIMSGLVTSLGTGNYTQRQIQVGTSAGNYTSNFTEAGSWNGIGLYGFYSVNVTGVSVGGTYYYRAGVTDNGTWVYGPEAVYIDNPPAASVVSFFSDISGTSADLFSYITSLPTGNATMRGVEIGLSSGNYSVGSYVSAGNWGGTGQIFGGYDTIVPGLSPGIVYHWRAKINTPSGWAVGSDQQFVFSYKPVVTTNDPREYAGIVYLLGSINSTGTAGNVTRVGFNIGTQPGVYNMTPYVEDGSWAAGAVFDGFSPDAMTDNTTYYIQAFAANAPGGGQLPLLGVGLEKSIVYHKTGPVGGISVNATGAFVSGTNVIVYGFITNHSLIPVSQVGFAWGTDNQTLGSYLQAAQGATGSFYYTVPGLLANTFYYWKAGVFVSGGWIWSSPTSNFTTGSNGPPVSLTAPTVLTLDVDPASITTSGFIAGGQLLSNNGIDIQSYGFLYGDSADAMYPYMASGNLSPSKYYQPVGGLAAGETVYVQAVVYNILGKPGLGAVKSVHIATATTPGTTGPGPGGGFIGWLNSLLVSLGMDNIMGHWGFIASVMFLVMALTAYFIIATKDRTDRTLKLIFAVTGALICAIILGGAIFSRFLGTMAIIVTIVLFVVVILGMAGVLLARSGAQT